MGKSALFCFSTSSTRRNRRRSPSTRTPSDRVHRFARHVFERQHALVLYATQKRAVPPPWFVGRACKTKGAGPGRFRGKARLWRSPRAFSRKGRILEEARGPENARERYDDGHRHKEGPGCAEKQGAWGFNIDRGTHGSAQCDAPFLPFVSPTTHVSPHAFSPQMALLNEVAAAPNTTHAGGQYGDGGNILTQQVRLGPDPGHFPRFERTARANSDPPS